MSEYDSFKIATFDGINQNPVAPTSTEAGNGSHLIAQLNGLIDKLKTDIADLTSRVETLEGAGASDPGTPYTIAFFVCNDTL